MSLLKAVLRRVGLDINILFSLLNVFIASLQTLKERPLRLALKTLYCEEWVSFPIKIAVKDKNRLRTYNIV